MPLTKAQKEQAMATMEEVIGSATSIVFMSYDGLTVEDVNELRTNLHESGGFMRVFPKRLLRVVLKNTKLEFNPLEHKGQLAVVWGDDAVAPAKTLNDFAKEHDEQVQLLAGALEGNILSLKEVTSLAQLPSREQLLGQLVGVMSGPVRGLATVLCGVQRQTVFVLQAIADKKQAAT